METQEVMPVLLALLEEDERKQRLAVLKLRDEKNKEKAND